MRRHLPMLAAVLAALVLGAVAGVLGWRWYEAAGGTRAPAFTLPDLEGDRRALGEWQGDVIVLNFWATWCAPCREEVPLFVDLQRRFGDRGVQFLGVAIDRPAEKVKRFAEEYGMNYPTLYGFENAMSVQAAYGNRAGTLPYTVVIDRAGRIRHVFQRAVEPGELAPILSELAAAP